MNEQLTHIDLFSGIGGFALAARWNGLRTVALCERDKFCQKILEKHWPEVPCCDDIYKFNGSDYKNSFIITGGFPCQPFSLAGKRRGAADDRAVWPEMFRIIAEARPSWVIAENVPGIINMELDNVCSDMESIGYDAQPIVIPACAVDARHRRDRVWIVGHSALFGQHDAAVAKSGDHQGQRPESFRRTSSAISNTIGDGISTQTEREARKSFERRSVLGTGWNGWEPEPRVARVVNGVPSRVDRIKSLGNAIVPQVAAEIIRIILEVEKQKETIK